MSASTQDDFKLEVVLGRLEPRHVEPLEQLLQGAGVPQPRERLGELVCICLDADGVPVGAAWVEAQHVPLLGGRRFWIYRSVLAISFDVAAASLLTLTWRALEGEFDPMSHDPIGLCLLLDHPGRMELQTEYPPFLYAGHTPYGQQVRVAYFSRARIGAARGPLMPPVQVPATERQDDGSWHLAGYRIGPPRPPDIEPLIQMWTESGALDREEAARRAAEEVILVATAADGPAAGASSAYVRYNEQLGMELWYVRVFVAPEHRLTDLAVAMALLGRDILRSRFTGGQDTRAGGTLFEVENDGLKSVRDEALWQPVEYTFIGENERRDHVRVHYFPGALTPEVPEAQGST